MRHAGKTRREAKTHSCSRVQSKTTVEEQKLPVGINKPIKHKILQSLPQLLCIHDIASKTKKICGSITIKKAKMGATHNTIRPNIEQR
jgi:hypothetical protein